MIKSLLQKLVRTGLEWIRPPRCDLGKEPATAEQQESKLELHDAFEMPHSTPPCKRLKEDRRYVNLTLKDMSLYNQYDTAYGTYASCQALKNESPSSDLMRKVEMCHEMEEFAGNMQRPKLLMPIAKVMLLRIPTGGNFKLPGACNPGPLMDPCKQDDDPAEPVPRRSPRLREKADQTKDT